MTSVPASAGPLQERILLLRIGGQDLAVEGRYVRGVVPVAEVTRVPRAPAHLLGIFHHLGRVVPLVDVRPALGLGPAASPAGGLSLLLEVPPWVVAAGIDEVVGFDTAAPDRGARLPAETPGGLRSHTRGAVHSGGRDYLLLDSWKLLESLRVE